MNVLSLCAGIGGLDLGLERAGMTVVGQVEIDPFCQRVLAKHWPEVPRHDDVRTAVDWWRSEPRPPVDLVCAGFPCQPVSLAGQRRGDADERWLWPAVRDAIRALRPRHGLLENVPGILAGWAGLVLGDLAEIGYDAEWDCVPASALGAPHRRDRWWCIATDSERDAVRQQSEPEPGSSRASVPGRDGASGDVADSGLQAGRGQRARRRVEQPSSGASAWDVADTTRLGGKDVPAGDSRQQLVPVDRAGRRVGGRHTAAGAGEPGRGAGIVAPTVADTNRARSPRRPGGKDRRPSPPRRLEPQRLGDRGPWQRPTPSGHWASEPDVGRVAHGIPARVDRLRGLGNAVVPQVAEHIGRLILAGAQ